MYNMTFNEDSGHWYMDIDGIRLVYEPMQGDFQKLVGWYRPDGWIEEQRVDGYTAMALDMIE